MMDREMELIDICTRSAEWALVNGMKEVAEDLAKQGIRRIMVYATKEASK